MNRLDCLPDARGRCVHCTRPVKPNQRRNCAVLRGRPRYGLGDYAAWTIKRGLRVARAVGLGRFVARWKGFCAPCDRRRQALNVWGWRLWARVRASSARRVG